MENKDLEYKLAVYSLLINFTALMVGLLAMYVAGPLTGIAVFTVTVILLLSITYKKETPNSDDENKKESD